MVNGVKCVIVSEALKSVEPMVWDFVMNFVRDNHLQVVEACLLPEAGQLDELGRARMGIASRSF